MAGGLSFTSPYGGRTVTASRGSSFNFTWTFFANDGLFKIVFGFMNSLIQTRIDGNDQLIGITSDGAMSIKQAYVGRLKGNWNNETNPGQVTFTLSSIKAQDSRLFGCLIQPMFLHLSPIIDPAKSSVVAKPYIWHCGRTRTLQSSHAQGICTRSP
ncbi:uncharacterized protein LOC111341463 [Stylophora pistillata]|uniref:uncharacterized protein LOC111341463 n=1 Tax=Stylophora pistillata TaxID=50429 RepID=UPI000C056CB6|nr:uncharacterized protein LOC111341463 [Stylophora pistillata]XP_022804174.1 uncharacterized protein LOC111341463 [Stylophora pistillata]